MDVIKGKINLEQIQVPMPVETKKGDWIVFGANNKYPDFIGKLFSKSPLHNRILTTKVEMISGEGFSYKKKIDKRTDKWIESPNRFENSSDLLRKVAWDLEVFGGFYLEIIWSLDRKSIAEIYHLPFNKMRVSSPDRYGNLNLFGYSDYWTSYKKTGFKPVIIPRFNENTPELFEEKQIEYDNLLKSFQDKTISEKEFEAAKENIPMEVFSRNQCFYSKPYKPLEDFYPKPFYAAGLDWIATDMEISNYHLAHISKGMSPKYCVVFPNSRKLDDEAKEKRVENFENSHNGTDSGGANVYYFAEGAEDAPILKSMEQPNTDKQFLTLKTFCEDNICFSHGITSPILAGIKTSGQLGGTQELVNAYSIYRHDVIDPHIKIIESAFNKILKVNGLQELSIVSTQPVKFTLSSGFADQLNIFTKDEIRKMYGYEPYVNVEQAEAEYNSTVTKPE